MSKPGSSLAILQSLDCSPNLSFTRLTGQMLITISIIIIVIIINSLRSHSGMVSSTLPQLGDIADLVKKFLPSFQFL